MTSAQETVFRKMFRSRSDEPTVQGEGIGRAFRRSIGQAGGEMGLKISFREIREECLDLPRLLVSLEGQTRLLTVLDGVDGKRGAMVLNSAMVAAVIEQHTLGQLSGLAPVERQLTRTDAAIAEPMITGVLSQLNKALTVEGLPYSFGAAVHDLHGLGIVLDDVRHRVLSAKFSMRGGAVDGEIILALPDAEPDKSESADAKQDETWLTGFRSNVEQASIELDVVLERQTMEIGQIKALEIGSCLNLPSSVLGQVTLEVKGSKYGRAKLGQAGGLRAVKLGVNQKHTLVEERKTPAVETTGVLPALAEK